MTLNKVPNTDDLRRQLSPTFSWTWAGNSDGLTNAEAQSRVIDANPPIAFLTSTNGTVTLSAKRASLSHDGTADEHAAVSWGSSHIRPRAGKHIYNFRWGGNGNPTNQSAPQVIGLMQNPANNNEDGNRQIGIRADNSNFTVVDDSGTKTTESIDLPFSGGSNEIQTAMVVDLDNDAAECYIESAPLVDSPDATISGLPSEPFEQPHIALFGGGDSSYEMRAVWGSYTALY